MDIKSIFEGSFSQVLNWPDYQYIVFLFALSIVFTLKEKKHVLKILGAFLIANLVGTGLSLGGVFENVSRAVGLISGLIVLFMGALNLRSSAQLGNYKVRIFLAATFGFFQGYHASVGELLSEAGGSPWFGVPLLSVGLTLAMLVVLSAFLILNWLMSNAFGMGKQNLNYILSGAVIGASLVFIMQNLF